MAGSKNRPLTLRDVSEASGVSEMTVSRVLRGRGDVSETTRERVLIAAKELGYVPNKIAGALASQKVNLVAVVIPSMSNMVFPEVMTGINNVLEETDLQPVVGITNYIPEKEEKVLYQMLSWRPSAVIIAGLEHSEASRAMLANSGIPVIQIMDIDGEPIDTAVVFRIVVPVVKWPTQSWMPDIQVSASWVRKCLSITVRANASRDLPRPSRKVGSRLKTKNFTLVALHFPKVGT